MTHTRMAPVMGLMMGGMIPLMAHGPLAGAGIAFVIAHLAIACALLGLVLVLPRARVWVATHRPTPAMVRRMGGGAVAGFALICSHCLLTWHGAT